MFNWCTCMDDEGRLIVESSLPAPEVDELGQKCGCVYTRFDVATEWQVNHQGQEVTLIPPSIKSEVNNEVKKNRALLLKKKLAESYKDDEFGTDSEQQVSDPYMCTGGGG